MNLSFGILVTALAIGAGVGSEANGATTTIFRATWDGDSADYEFDLTALGKVSISQRLRG